MRMSSAQYEILITRRNPQGNVWEWTQDPFPGRPDRVTLRGGGWGNNPYCLRVSYRHANPPDIGLDMVGVRCAADALRPQHQPADDALLFQTPVGVHGPLER